MTFAGCVCSCGEMTSGEAPCSPSENFSHPRRARSRFRSRAAATRAKLSRPRHQDDRRRLARRADRRDGARCWRSACKSCSGRASSIDAARRRRRRGRGQGGRDGGAGRLHAAVLQHQRDGDDPGAGEKARIRSGEGFRAGRESLAERAGAGAASRRAGEDARRNSSPTAKANPGKLNCGATGYGGLPHMAAEYFKVQAGVDFAIVNYKGGGDTLNAVLGHQVDMTFETTTVVLPLHPRRQDARPRDLEREAPSAWRRKFRRSRKPACRATRC